MWFVAGLGNPGPRYEDTRHNAGFLVVDRLAGRWGIPLERKLFGALVGDGSIRELPVLLVQPQTFMNRSGHPTRSVMGLHEGQLEQLVVVHDDLDLPFGTVRVKRGGGHGGHNGLRDLHRHLGAGDYLRVRVGIGRPSQGIETSDHVLAPFGPVERESLDEVLERAADAVEAVLAEGVTAAMNTFNVRRPAPASEPEDTAEQRTLPIPQLASMAKEISQWTC